MSVPRDEDSVATESRRGVRGLAEVVVELIGGLNMVDNNKL